MDKLDHLGWVVSSSFAIGDVRFGVRSTSPSFGAWLSTTLGAYEVEDVEEFLYSVVVPEPPAGGKAKEFCILYKGSTAIIRTLDPVTVGRGLLAELEGLRFHERDDAVYVTASIVDVAGTPTLVPSSLAPGLAKLGRRAGKLGVGIPGELSVAIDMETATVVPVRRTLDVPDDALRRLAEACPWTGRDGLRFVDAPETIEAFLVPATDPEAPLQPARKGFALANLAGWTLNLQVVGGRGLDALGRFVEKTAAYGSAWTDTAEIMEQLASTMKERT
jgi:hypothetical protein